MNEKFGARLQKRYVAHSDMLRASADVAPEHQIDTVTGLLCHLSGESILSPAAVSPVAKLYDHGDIAELRAGSRMKIPDGANRFWDRADHLHHDQNGQDAQSGDTLIGHSASPVHSEGAQRGRRYRNCKQGSGGRPDFLN